MTRTPGSELQTPATLWWKRFVHEYARTLAKNVIGWVLIALSLVLGPMVPGPGGIPIFLIGFAMVSFPGKRRLTARVMRGRQIGRPHRTYHLVSVAISLVLASVGTLLLTLNSRLGVWLAGAIADPRLAVFCAYLALASIFWMGMRLLPSIVNVFLPWVPPIRRKIRPWMRRHGLHLLPPRHRDRHAPFDSGHRPHDEILMVTERFSVQFRHLWLRGRRWALYLACVGLVVLVAWVTLKHR